MAIAKFITQVGYVAKLKNKKLKHGFRLPIFIIQYVGFEW